jgi:hypothetical protein
MWPAFVGVRFACPFANITQLPRVVTGPHVLRSHPLKLKGKQSALRSQYPSRLNAPMTTACVQRCSRFMSWVAWLYGQETYPGPQKQFRDPKFFVMGYIAAQSQSG